MEKLRVWNIVNPPSDPKYYEVESLEYAIILTNTLANQQLQDDSIECNVFGLEVFNEDEQEWEDWYDTEGLNIDAYELKDGKAVYIEAEED